MMAQPPTSSFQCGCCIDCGIRYAPEDVLQLRGGIQSYLSSQAQASPPTSTEPHDQAETAEHRNEDALSAAAHSEEPECGPGLEEGDGRGVLTQGRGSWEGVCFVFDERTAVAGQGERVTVNEAAAIGDELGPRCGTLEAMHD